MKNTNFNNVPDPNQNEEILESVRKFQEAFKHIAESSSPSLSPTAIQIAVQLSQIFLPFPAKCVLNIVHELANNIKTQKTTQAVKSAIQILSENTLTSSKFSTQPIIEFTEDEIQTIENLNIDLEVYSNKEKTNNKRRIFTKKNLVEIIGLLLALIALIQNCIYHLEDDKQSQETAQQIEELNESQKKTNELLETIIRQMPEYTEDEISSPD